MFKKYVACLVTSLNCQYRTQRFQPATDIAGQTPVKSSVQRGIRSALLSSWKVDAETLEEIWPKKESIVHVKWSVALHPRVSSACFFLPSPLILLDSNQNHQTAEITSPYMPCTASPYSSSTMTDPIFPHCVCSTNASEPSCPCEAPGSVLCSLFSNLPTLQIHSCCHTSASTAARSGSCSRAHT